MALKEWPWPWPFRSQRQADGLTGDMRPLKLNDSAQLIDCKWPEPRPILITADTSSSLIAGTWTLNWSIDRGQFGTVTVNGATFSRVVLARAVQLFVTGVQGTAQARAVAIEASLSIDALSALLTPGTPSAMFGPPLTVVRNEIAVTAFPGTATLALADAARRGLVVHNFSPAGRNLAIKLGGPPTVSIGNRDFFLPPNASIDIPGPDFAGLVQCSWDGADAGGWASVAELFT